MRERPILFSAPMIRAILDGRKTVTRRIVKPQPPTVEAVHARSGSGYSWITPDRERIHHHRPAGPVWAVRELMGCEPQLLCPYGQPGDRLWVKERWRPSVAHSHGAGECDCGDVNVEYRADGEVRFFRDDSIPFEWTMPKAAARGDVTPLFMPRWASRITLEVTGVRVERLQDISEDQAKAEGVEPINEPNELRWPHYAPHGVAFAALWEQINGAGSWDANPWVWAVEFKRIEQEHAHA